MFKVKPTKKSSTNINNTNCQAYVSERRIELCQNNDLINIQDKPNTEHAIGQSLQMSAKNQASLVRNTSLRPKSGINRNITKQSKPKYQKTDQQMIQERIKQKLMSTTIQRPSTSGINQNSGVKYAKKQKLLNRRGTMNASINGNSSSGIFMGQKTKTIAGTSYQCEQEDTQGQYDTQYISNEDALSIMLAIMDEQEDYARLKATNAAQFERIRQKLISNISIIVLKWYKLLQDKLYYQVRNLGAKKTQNQDTEASLNSIPQTIEQLIGQQIRRHFSKENGLFLIEQRCSSQQDKLSRLIDTRLQRLEGLLTSSGPHSNN